MPVLNSGVRAGAAAFVLGLSLAGPQALGVANADTSAADSTSVSAGAAEPSAVSGDESSPSRAAVGRGGRGVKPSDSVISGCGHWRQPMAHLRGRSRLVRLRVGRFVGRCR